MVHAGEFLICFCCIEVISNRDLENKKVGGEG